MRRIVFLVLVAVLQVQSAFACSIDALKKIADEPLDRLPSSIMHEPDGIPENRTGDGAMWQAFFHEDGHTKTILLSYLAESGETKVRMSFLNRRDFVVVHTRIEYNKPYLGPGGDGTFKIEPPEYYFFCAGQFQIPAGTPEGTKAAEKANVWKNTMSESTGLLKQEFDLIPE